MQAVDNNIASREPVDEQSLLSSQIHAKRVDTSLLGGLRAFASIDILFEHYLMLIIDGKIDLQGGSCVQLFFLLSGFVLGVAYGKRKFETWNDCNKFAREFYAKRAARLLPIYYVALLLCWPGYKESFENNRMDFVLQWFLLTSWSGGVPTNLPLWQISTMIFLYLCFPYILPAVQRVRARFSLYTLCYFLQMVLFYSILIGLQGTSIAPRAYFLARGTMISRLPVFIMGILVGLERILPHKNQNCSSFLLFPVASWSSHYTDVLCLTVFVLMFVGFMFSSWTLLRFITSFSFTPRFLLEPGLAYIQGLMIYSVTTENSNSSLFGKIARLPPVVYLGTISLSTYAFQWAVLIFCGRFFFSDSEGTVRFPRWFVLVGPVLVILVAHVSNELVEKRLTNWVLKKIWNPKSSLPSQGTAETNASVEIPPDVSPAQ